MTELTEQCKKGELPVGKYYIECKDGSVTTMYLGNDDYSVRSIKSKGFKIIAPVPTFDEWKETYNCMLENEVLRLKNAQLKELLKEWVQFEIEENPNDFTVMSERMSGLANKTKEVLK
jgi:hypothetical protein